MSMNLHCAEVELLQTPTNITYMCLNENHDDPDRDWRAIRDRYFFWLDERMRDLHRFKLDKDSWQEHRDFTNEHKKELMSFDKLTFYIM